ncbi:MAG TPA: DUF2231 domain-containing protein [Micropepsaceae bacterium]|nr:DUF2231 domain-containing protein [Micropepsaceae bacterium]
MHVIPQSWSHLHILIGVFPTFGLLIVFGFYFAGRRAGDEFTQRICRILLVLLALLGIPIYVSGIASAADLAGNPRYSPDAISTHYFWGLAAIGVLAIAGLIAFVELWRTWLGRRLFSLSGPALAHATAAGSSYANVPENTSSAMVAAEAAGPSYSARAAQSRGVSGYRRISAKHLGTWNSSSLLAGFAIIALALTVVASELGFPINHHELELAVTIPDISTPQAWSHAHLILNHVPTAGFVFALAFYVTALVANNDVLKRGSLVLFVICGIAGVPTYVAGTAAMWALTQPTIPEISKAVINSHRDMALWSLFGLAFTGATSWIELWRARSRGQFSQRSLNLILLFAIVTLAIMTETGHRGGLINHPEIRLATDILPTDANAGFSMSLETLMKDMIWFVPWQIVHFFGYCLIFGTVFAVTLRVFGFWKSIPFAAMHQLLLLGFIGVVMNVVSGMMMMFADSYRYVVSDTTFAPKIALITIGTIAVLWFSLSARLWKVKAGENAPRGAKWAGAVALVAWAGVIVCGRLLAFL